MKDNIELNKQLCERYPYLIPRNLWTDKISKDYDYSYIRGDYELPEGWKNLFLQMCEDIRQPLIDANYLDKFRFSQIKEKYGLMRCYTNGAPHKVHEIIDNYEHVSQYVCQHCGKPATKMSPTGWIENWCDECYKTRIRPETWTDEVVENIEFDPIRCVITFENDKEKEINFDCSDIWSRMFSK